MITMEIKLSRLRILALTGAIFLLGSSLTAEARCMYDSNTMHSDCSNMWDINDYIERTVARLL